jgi:PTH1 family peptidyl-tRNA hydrolase
MKLIVGLGNPGVTYAKTRHNIGFELVDALASAHGIKVDRRQARALVGRGTINETPVLLVKPQTFMNLSGVAVAALLKAENVTLTDLLVLVDDIRLPVGKIRLRAQGSAGGQNGLKSLIASLESDQWARLRIGVGEPPEGSQIDWVLSRFATADRKVMDETLITAMGAVEVWLKDGIETAMNRFNGG